MERAPPRALVVALLLFLVPLLPSVAADNDIATAAIMTDGNSASGNVDYDGDDIDWWKIFAYSGDIVQVSISSSMSNPAWWCPGDGYTGKVKLTNSGGTLLAGDNTIDDSSSSTVLSTTSTSQQWIYLRILSEDSFCNDGISYSLTPSIDKTNRDTDDDGFIDNDDDCDELFGNSTNDRNGCLDSDGDGYSDPEVGWSAHPQGQADAFPLEGTQWYDSDGDGYGDELLGFQGDHCTYQRGFSDQDRYGCLDSDVDGWSDPDPVGLNSSTPWPAHPEGTADAFLTDATQWNDTDADGFGDNWADGDWNDSRVNQTEPLGEWSLNATTPDNCPSIEGYSVNDRFGCPDLDEDGWSNPDANWTENDGADAFPSNPTQWKDRDGDGWGDNQSGDAYQVDIFPDNPTQWADFDGDGYGDNNSAGASQVDNFTTEATQWSDFDGDGFGDNFTGFQGDHCPESEIQHIVNNQISFIDRFGCYDSDQDGYSNPSQDWVAHPSGFADAFPDEVSQWFDSDSDEYGDNLEYKNASGATLPAYRGDSCPFTPGFSTDDRWGCPDSDNDGWSDPMWDWLASPQGLGDAWPSDPTQWHDHDGDGYGDNPLGTTADACPDTPGTSVGVEEGGDRWGCHDTDNDGWSNLGDAFIHEPTQFRDSDGDGWGDNTFGHEGDDCPEVRGDSLFDRKGCRDIDADGWSDPDSEWSVIQGADAFLNDRMQWRDSDGDGFGDNGIGAKRDDCPTISGTSTVDLQGCPDANGDGYSDQYGELNAAIAMMGENPLSSWLTYAGIGIALLFPVIFAKFLGIIFSRGNRKTTSNKYSDSQAPEIALTVPVHDINTGLISPALQQQGAANTGYYQPPPLPVEPANSAPQVAGDGLTYGQSAYGDISAGYTAGVAESPYEIGGEGNV